MVYFWQQFLNVSTDFQIKMVKMLKILVRGDEIELLPFSFEKPQYADIPKTKEYTSENEHTLFANKSNAEIGSENGIRSCIKVNELSECRSGKIFEHEEVCKEPSLRY